MPVHGLNAGVFFLAGSRVFEGGHPGSFRKGRVWMKLIVIHWINFDRPLDGNCKVSRVPVRDLRLVSNDR